MTGKRGSFCTLLAVILILLPIAFLAGQVNAATQIVSDVIAAPDNTTSSGTASADTTINAVPADPAVNAEPAAALPDATANPDIAADKLQDPGAKNIDQSLASASAMTLSSSSQSAGASAASTGALTAVQISPGGNSGAAITSIPIEVPPGRKGIQPNISLNYNSNSGNGWLGVGWSLDMGAIQRNTKRGVNYSNKDFVAVINGAASELVQRGATDYYDAKIEGAFSKYYLNPSGGWEVTTKDGTKYYYGTTALSRQDSALGVFKWCLDKVQDTNGNYMTILYTKNQGEIYPDRIDYTGNTAGLGTTNSVKFHLESRPDAPVMYTTQQEVKTNSRLKSIVIRNGSSLVRAYLLSYTPSVHTSRSLLSGAQQYGSDADVNDETGEVTGTTFLPAIGITYSVEPDGEFGSVQTPTDTTSGYSSSTWKYTFADVSGDGKADAIAYFIGDGQTSGNYLRVRTSNGDGTFNSNIQYTDTTGYTNAAWKYAFADVDGDGRADAIANYIGSGLNDGTKLRVRLANDNGTFGSIIPTDSSSGYSSATWKYAFADVTGDGKADAIAYFIGDGQTSGNYLRVRTSNGNGTFSSAIKNTDTTGYTNAAWEYAFADVNGDGRADAIANYIGSGQNDGTKLRVRLANEDGTFGSIKVTDSSTGYSSATWKYAFADVNGDGMADAIAYFIGDGQTSGNYLRVRLSNGNGTFGSDIKYTDTTGYTDTTWKYAFADINGDGRADAIANYIGSGQNDGTKLRVRLANGDGTFGGIKSADSSPSGYSNAAWRYAFADTDGDGTADAISHYIGSGLNDGTRLRVRFPRYEEYNLARTVSNGIGAYATLEYLPSSIYDNCFDVNGKDTCLPFVVQTLSKTTVSDGNGVSSESNYSYKYGYFDYIDREFRGFGDSKAIAPNGTATETMFYTYDNIFKGLPYSQLTKDSSDPSGVKYMETYNTYQYTTPYTGVTFPYLSQKDDYVYDGTETAKQAATSFTYDSYGNITRKYFHGDVAITGDEMDEYTEFTYDTTNWIVGLPSHTYLNDSGGITKAQAWFTYDTKGNLLTKTAWLNGGTNPVIAYTYDTYGYGNVVTVTDARNYTSTIAYDSTYTYPVQMTNPLGQVVTKTYDTKFGKVLTEMDSNNNTTTYEYDVFGRIIKVTNSNDTTSPYGTMSYYYLNLGTVGSQKVVTYATEQSGTGNYIWSETYFDGVGRTFKTRAEGPDNKVIVAETKYKNTGLVDSESLPYFEGLETARWRTYQYDPIGRITRMDNPDVTYATSSYMKGTLTYIDPNGHKKVQVKDVYGRVTRVEEYTGSTAGNYALYADTEYKYDVLGNLETVIDANNDKVNPVYTTTITYDSLSRKTSMSDPDMGGWEYHYDANGNLISQTDAKSQTIAFSYDELNRITLKDYPAGAGTDVVYNYDEPFSTYAKGRLTTITDASGTATFYYDKLGQTVKTIRTVDSVSYTTESPYDALGRTDTVTYPDNSVVKYEYDTGGNLLRVKNNSSGLVYAAYTGYNALGQIGRTDYGNGVNTIYQYQSLNNRLYSITTAKQSTGFINLSYAYDNVGNITGITDYLDSTRNRTYGYDDLNRLTSATSTSYGGTLTWQYNAIGNMTYNSRYGNYTYPTNGIRPHAVTQAGADTYTYDANGNMTSGAGRTFTYDYDNRATGIVKDGAATINVYDAGGQRVKKVTPGFTTVYIGSHYECTNGICTKYIFGGSDRIVSIEGTNTRYYHSDHLGSSSVITDQNGVSVQSIYYYPYGETHTIIGTDVARHKFTGQEYDAETGLYYYGARYYDPKLARFITADTIVPNPGNPQDLNRYAYCSNNPVNYVDPSGHNDIADFFDDLWEHGGKEVLAAGTAVLAFVFIQPAAYSLLAFGNFTTQACVLSETTHIALIAGSSAIAGSAAGASAAAMMGGNIGQGAGTGAVLGLASSLIGVPSFQPFGSSAAGSIGNRLFNSSLTGGAFGATYSGVTGENIWQGAARGAMAWGLGEGANMGIGHIVGFLGSGGEMPEFSNGSFIYKGNPLGALTIGNVTWGYNGMSSTVLQHEVGHTYQSIIFGPAYLPLHIVDKLTSTHGLEYSSASLGRNPTYWDLYAPGRRPWTWWMF